MLLVMAATPLTIEQLIDAVIGREGGYSDHPADKGGPTRWGITEQVARAWGYKSEMRVLPREVAVGIYRRRYWTDPRLHLVAERLPAIAAELFDIGVNMGVAMAATLLQRALNALNRGASDYPDIAVDGGIGQMTIASIEGFRQRRGAAGEAILLCALRALRGARYIEISEARAANEAFTYGWFGRMVEMAGGK